MSEEDSNPPKDPKDELGNGDFDTADIRSLVRRAEAAHQEPVDLVAGFQRKLRKRSGGKFYADGWSTVKQPPIMTYLITSLIMLAVVGAVYVVLHPFSGEPVTVPMQPAPVHVLPPKRSK